MTAAEDPLRDAADPAKAAILNELATQRRIIDDADKARDTAQARRVDLWRQGLNVGLTRVAMGGASGLSAEYITKALRPPAEPAKPKRARTTR